MMRTTIFVFITLILFQVFCGKGAIAAHIKDEIILPGKSLTIDEISTRFDQALWNTNKTAAAVSIQRPNKSEIFIFIIQGDDRYLVIDVSAVEDGNFGKLGITGRTAYERFETKPVRWLSRSDQLIQVEIRTRAWKEGQRFTVSELLVISPEGTVLWR